MHTSSLYISSLISARTSKSVELLVLRALELSWMLKREVFANTGQSGSPPGAPGQSSGNFRTKSHVPAWPVRIFINLRSTEIAYCGSRIGLRVSCVGAICAVYRNDPRPAICKMRAWRRPAICKGQFDKRRSIERFPYLDASS